MTFDAIAFYHQLMRASGTNDFPLVPNTLVNALKDKKSRIVVTTAKVWRFAYCSTCYYNQWRTVIRPSFYRGRGGGSCRAEVMLKLETYS